MREGGALEVLHGVDLLGHLEALGIRERLELLRLQRLQSILVLAQVELGPDEDDGGVRAVVAHLRVPLWTTAWEWVVRNEVRFLIRSRFR